MVASFAMQLEEKDLKRFWAKVDKSPGQGPNGDCWEWKAGITKGTGYGKFGLYHGKTIDAHRFICIYIHGFDMDGLDARHLCHNRACCRPSHITKGTRKENMDDAIKANRTARGGGSALGTKNGMVKLTEDQVRQVRERCKNEHHAAIARSLQVSTDCIWDIINGRTWKHLT